MLQIYPASAGGRKIRNDHQIRRAALSVHLNIAEGASRKSEAERRRYFEIARGSIIEIDAALDVANDLSYLKSYDMTRLSELIIAGFKMLTGLINSTIKIERH